MKSLSVERTLLTSGMTLAGVESLHLGQFLKNSDMNVRYRLDPNHFGDIKRPMLSRVRPMFRLIIFSGT